MPFSFCSCFSSTTTASNAFHSSDSLFTLSSQLSFHLFVFSFTMVPTASISAKISSNLVFEALYFSTYHPSFAHISLQQIAANGILSSHAILCFAMFHAFRSWHASKPHSSFSLSTVNSRFGKSTKTRRTRGAWFLYEKKATTPSVPNHSSG